MNPYYNVPPQQRLTQRLVDQFNADEALWRKLEPQRAKRRLRTQSSRKELNQADLLEFAKARPLSDCIGHPSARLPSKVYSKELVELIFTQPYSKIQFLVDAGLAQRQTASEYLQELEKLGVLVGEKRGREFIYKHPALLKLLTA